MSETIRYFPQMDIIPKETIVEQRVYKPGGREIGMNQCFFGKQIVTAADMTMGGRNSSCMKTLS